MFESCRPDFSNSFRIANLRHYLLSGVRLNFDCIGVGDCTETGVSPRPRPKSTAPAYQFHC